MSLAAKAWAAAAVPETLGKRAGAGIGAARKRESGILSAPTHRQRRSPNPLASVGVSWRELSPGHVCRGFFHWNADVAPLYRRKPATKGGKAVGAAADASLLPYVHSVSLCAPRSGFLAPAPPFRPGLFFGGSQSARPRRGAADRCEHRQAAGAATRAAADKRGVTRLQPHSHDVRAMSACVPTADVSLQRGR